MAASKVCTRHYRAAEATCERCGGGLCSQCRGSGPTALAQSAGESTRVGGRAVGLGLTALSRGAGPPLKLCPGCIQFDGDTRRRSELRRADRFALRRAGYAVGFERGDPIVLWSGPLRMAIPSTGMVLLVAVAGTALAAGQIRAGIDVVLGVLLISVVVGNAVRRLFGGVSPVAGLCAAAAAVGTALCGRWLAGDGRTYGGAPFEGLRHHTDHLFASGWPLPACLAAAALIAYFAAAGRRTRHLRAGV